MKKSLVILIASVFVFTIFLYDTVSTNKAYASYISEVSPNLINNNASIDVDVRGFDFNQRAEMFIGDYLMENIVIHSSNYATGGIPKGLNPGKYDLRLKNPEDNLFVVLPDAFTVYGENVDLEVIDIKKEITSSGFRYLLDTNLPVKAKVLCGEDDSHLMMVSKKKTYSQEHILAVGFPLEENIDYYVCQVVVRSEDAQELELPVDVLKWTRKGFDITDYDIEVQSPKVSVNEEDNSAEISVKANKSIHFRVSTKLFEGDSWQIAYLPEDDDYNHLYKVTLDDLDLNTMHFIRIEGETDGQGVNAEKFENEFQFYFKEIVVPEEVIDNEDEVIDLESDEDAVDEVFFKDESPLEQALIEEFSTKELSAFVPSVEALIRDGVLEGNGNKLYPNRHITRAEFVALICRASGFDVDVDKSAFFSDVPATHFAYGCLSILVDKGITKGFGDGTFRPDSTLTRGGAITMLSRAFNLDLETEYTGSNFKDVNEDYDLWMYVNSVYDQGWLQGEYARPNDNLKRAEAFDWIAISFGLVDSVEFTDIALAEEEEPVKEESVTEDEETRLIAPEPEEEVVVVEEPEVIEEVVVVKEPEEVVVIEEEVPASAGVTETEELTDEDEELMKLLENLL